MHEKIGIFVNSASQERYKRRALDLSLALHIHPTQLAFPLDSIPEHVETAIVVGGDGTVKAVMEKLLQRENPGLLVVVPAGSQNGLYHALKDEQSTISIDELQSGETAKIPPYTSGSIQGDIFIHLADLTKAGLEQLRYAEVLRPFIPRKARAFAAIAVAYCTIKKGDDFPFFMIKTLMPTPFIGTKKTFPQQKVYGDDITLISLQAENKRQGAAKMGLLAFYVFMGRMPPESIAEVRTERSFTIDVYSQEFNIDGEKRRIPNSGTVFVARHHKSLQTAALFLQ